MKIAVAGKRLEKKLKNKEISWEDLLALLSQTKRTHETVDEYRKMGRAAQADIKDCGGFVAGELKEGRRKNGMVNSRSALTLDMDYALPDTWQKILMLFAFRCCVYSTHKHTPEQPRLRLVIPLSRDISEEEYPAVARMVAKDIGIDLFDDTTYEACRLMYWPSTSINGEFFFDSRDGELLDPDAYLNRYTDWHDASTWPVSSRQSAAMKRTISEQQDPLSKPGVVGAFCRAYTIEDVIDTYLAEIYEPSAMPGRYDYIPADSSAGLVVYDSKFAYSHHATDPVCGKLLNAFDLVRLHLFGSSDENAPLETPVTKLPSYKAMCEIALDDSRVKMVFAEERKAQAEEEFSDDDWQAQLTLDKFGNVKDTMSNVCTILRNDVNLKGIVFNQFKSTIDVISPLPWPQVKPGWNDTDLACAKLYFERTYGVWSPTKFKDALLAVTSAERLYHPIKEYFSTLKWDGVRRLDTLLIDYLGAADTPYVRAVTRKTLVAAVARIYQPGIKFDSILVLVGGQGIGKSTFFARLGKKWFSDSLSISDMKDKTAPEKLQGYWILEISELNGMKKMDVEVVKSFVTRVDDKYRQAYGTTVESHPRSCVIVGTTNSDGGFLRDTSGNRRYWPARVSGNSKYKPWELNDVDQIWAEALQYYNDGEELFLKDEIAAEAYIQQRDAMETDDREGIVQEYLDRLLPENWDTLDLYQRRAYLEGTDFGEVKAEGTVQRKYVCVMEIWCECFGKSRENLKKADSYEIEGILYKLGCWKHYTGSASGKTRISGYGVQKTFVRVSEDLQNQ